MNAGNWRRKRRGKLKIFDYLEKSNFFVQHLLLITISAGKWLEAVILN